MVPSGPMAGAMLRPARWAPQLPIRGGKKAPVTGLTGGHGSGFTKILKLRSHLVGAIPARSVGKATMLTLSSGAILTSQLLTRPGYAPIVWSVNLIAL